MKWPHWLIRTQRHDTGQAHAALMKSRSDLRAVQDRWPEVRAVSEDLRAQRRINSLAQAISDALGSAK